MQNHLIVSHISIEKFSFKLNNVQTIWKYKIVKSVSYTLRNILLNLSIRNVSLKMKRYIYLRNSISFFKKHELFLAIFLFSFLLALFSLHFLLCLSVCFGVTICVCVRAWIDAFTEKCVHVY